MRGRRAGGRPGPRADVDGDEIYASQAPNLQHVKVSTPGVLRLGLRSNSYTWKFVPIAGKFTDSGTDTCH